MIIRAKREASLRVPKVCSNKPKHDTLVSMMTRTELHQIVDELPEEEVDSAAEVLDAYRRGDRALIQLLTAPVVLTEPDELAALAELTDDDLANVISDEEMRSRLGIA